MQGIQVKLADAITATGTARVNLFSIPGGPALTGQKTVTIFQKGATVLTVAVEISWDGGTTWVTYLAAFNLIPAAVQVVLPSGAPLRLNVATLTTTPADIYGILN